MDSEEIRARLSEISGIEHVSITKDTLINAELHKINASCNSENIMILTPIEIFIIADKLSIKTEKFINNYCEIKVSNSTGLPMIQLVNKGRCPFINKEEGKCKLENCKPIACGLYPVARVKVRNIHEKDLNDDYKLFLPADYISESQDSLTVADWLELNNINKLDKELKVYYKRLTDFSIKYDFNKFLEDPIIPTLIKGQTCAVVYHHLFEEYESYSNDYKINERFDEIDKAFSAIADIYEPILKK